MVAGLGLLGAALGGGWLALVAQGDLGLSAFTALALSVVALVLLVGGLLLLLGALGYYVLAPAFMGGGMAWHGVGSHRLIIATTLLIVMLANTVPGAYLYLAGVGEVRTPGGLLTAAFSIAIALLVVTYLRFIRPGIVTARDLGLDWHRLPRLLGQGVAIGVGAMIVSGAIQATMRWLGVPQTQLADLSYIREFPLWAFLAVLFAGGILGPIAEELYFRGAVFGTYVRTRGPWVSYGVTSLVFATLHLNLPALLPILALSLVLCFAYRRTGSIIPSMTAHAVNNCTAFCILYFARGVPGV